MDHSDRMNAAAQSLGVSLIVVFNLSLEQAEVLAATFREAANKTLELNEDAIAAEPKGSVDRLHFHQVSAGGGSRTSRACRENHAAKPEGVERLECGYFAPCEQDADHDGPHTAGMYPDWQVPSIEPMEFIGSGGVEGVERLDTDLLARARDIIERYAPAYKGVGRPTDAVGLVLADLDDAIARLTDEGQSGVERLGVALAKALREVFASLEYQRVYQPEHPTWEEAGRILAARLTDKGES